mgnify:CR=1 FL=1
MKIIFKLGIFLILVIIFLVSYLTFVGFETKKFNDQIIKKIKNINQNLDIELKEIKIILDPLELKLKAKTIGPNLKNKNKVLEIENINTQIPLKSLFSENIFIENLSISTKSLKIKDLISFVRIFNQNPELYILEKIIKKGFLVADIKLDFDKDGNIKKNYKINGFIKDAKINILKKYKIDKLNLSFNYEENFLDFNDTNLLFNNLNFYSKNLNLRNIKDEIFIKGDIENKNFELDDENIKLFIKPHFPNLDIKKIKLNSKNKFSFKINKKFQFNNFNLTSEVELKDLLFLNKIDLKNFFPKINEEIKLINQKIKIDYKKSLLKVDGGGDILLQNNYDELYYSIIIRDKKYDFKTSFKIKKNPFIINLIDYEKKENTELKININGSKKSKNKIKLNLVSLKDKNSKFNIEDLIFNEKFKIIDLQKADIDYLDREDNINKFNIRNKNNTYYLEGSFLNADKIIENLLNEDSKSSIIEKNFKLKLNLNKLSLDKKHSVNNFKGILLLKNQEIINGKLTGNFSNNKKFKYTVKTDGDEKITTLFLDRADSIVSRYKFIKGFDEGALDFYSSKKGDESISTLKIYDFKLKEVPTLTKLLTLASLQGIADLLSGEGIRFDEFEMNFKNKNSLMTIDEIYAIGPAISILMDGYIEKKKLVSLRGTLVPATTINKAIGSIPLLGQILVGSKTGEGVFGVSFKIKGPAENLETSVNPIKTLTPRFITRTLEKIKKN